MKQDKVLSMLGLARRAGKTKSGSFSAEKSVKSGKAALVIIAEDVSENTRKLFTDKCSFRKIPIFTYATMDALGNAIGSEGRAVVSVEDPGFARALIKLLDDKDPLADKDPPGRRIAKPKRGSSG